MSPAARDLAWPDTYNMRDLGGLPRDGGGWTRRGQLVRGDDPHRLDAAGWRALHKFGVRTVVDLQQADETRVDRNPRPTDLALHRIPLDDPSDTEFWRSWSAGLDCTPLYYSAFLERFPRRVGAVAGAVAGAPAGGVLVHCGSGRDRTGLIALVLLRLAGVTPEAIALDYTASTERLEPAWRDAGLGDQTTKIAALLAQHHTTAYRVVFDVALNLDAESYLRRAGLSQDQLAALRDRLAAP